MPLVTRSVAMPASAAPLISVADAVDAGANTDRTMPTNAPKVMPICLALNSPFPSFYHPLQDLEAVLCYRSGAPITSFKRAS